jgi:hypothetical protein
MFFPLSASAVTTLQSLHHELQNALAKNISSISVFLCGFFFTIRKCERTEIKRYYPITNTRNIGEEKIFATTPGNSQ